MALIQIVRSLRKKIHAQSNSISVNLQLQHFGFNLLDPERRSLSVPSSNNQPCSPNWQLIWAHGMFQLNCQSKWEREGFCGRLISARRALLIRHNATKSLFRQTELPFAPETSSETHKSFHQAFFPAWYTKFPGKIWECFALLRMCFVLSISNKFYSPILRVNLDPANVSYSVGDRFRRYFIRTFYKLSNPRRSIRDWG